MKDLEKYYGKEMVYVVTRLLNDNVTTDTRAAKVYNPKDFKNCHVAPTSGCDLVIGDNSVNSKYIYDEGGVDNATSEFSIGRFDSITLFNYCFKEQIEQVKGEHESVIIKTLEDFISNEQNRVDKTKEILTHLKRKVK